MAKKERYTAEQVREALTKHHGLVSGAAGMLGCSVQTIYNYIEKYQTVKDAVAAESEKLKDLAESRLFRCIDQGQAWAICFYLKCKAKDRGYVERQEIEITKTKYEIVLPEDLKDANHNNRPPELAEGDESILLPTIHE